MGTLGLKNTITKIKNTITKINNSINGLNYKMEGTVTLNKLEDRATEIIQSEQQTENRLKKMEPE